MYSMTYVFSAFWFSSKNVTDPFVRVELLPVNLKIAQTKVHFLKLSKFKFKKVTFLEIIKLYAYIVVCVSEIVFTAKEPSFLLSYTVL
jgi:hypothetical protein